MQGNPSPPEEGPGTELDTQAVNLPPVSPKGPETFQQGNCALQNRKWSLSSEFVRITGRWLWTDPDSRRHRTSLWPTRYSRGLRESDNRWVFSSQPPQGGPANSPSPSYGYFSSYRRCNGRRRARPLAERPRRCPHVRTEGCDGGKDQAQAARPAPPRGDLNRKHCFTERHWRR